MLKFESNSDFSYDDWTFKMLPMLVHKYVDQIGSATKLVAKRSAGAALEMNLRMPLHAGNEAHK